MRITYDPEVDILLVTLADAEADKGAEITPGVVIDYDEHGNPIGLEIQHASERYRKEDLLRLSVEEPIPLSTLAAEYGFAEAHLRRLAISGRLSARKIGRNWAATRADLEEYLLSRKYNAKAVPRREA